MESCKLFSKWQKRRRSSTLGQRAISVRMTYSLQEDRSVSCVWIKIRGFSIKRDLLVGAC